MKMSIEAAMEIWELGGGVAASEWQEKTPGWSRRGPIYRRRPIPCFCLEYTRVDVERLARGHAAVGDHYWQEILDNVTGRLPKVRKIIAVHDPHGLRTACEDAKIPMPQLNVDGTWKLGGLVATAEVWMAGSERKERKFTEAFGLKPAPRYVWQELAKRLADPAALAS